MQGVPSGWPPGYPNFPGYAPPIGAGATSGPGIDVDPMTGLDLPVHHDDPVHVEAGKGDIDNDAQWLGIAVVAGGVVVTTALFAWLAVVNKKEHEVLEAKIEGVDQRLVDYQQAHALVHSVLQRQIEGLRPAPRAPLTVYGTPYQMPAPTAVPVPLPTMPPTYVSPYGTSFAPPVYVPPPPVSFAPDTIPVSSGSRPTFALPSHLESALTSSGRAASAASRRASRFSHRPTLAGV